MNKPTHHTTSIADKVLEKIQTEHIAPTPRSYFVARNIALWIPGVFITVLGAISWAGIFFSLTHANWGYQPFLRPSLTHLIWDELPLVWIILFSVFAVGITAAFKKTKHGYRWSARAILGTSMCISIVSGLLLFASDYYIANPLLRRPSEDVQRALWSHPEEGRLAGNITITKESVVLTDREQHTWRITGIEHDFFAHIPEEKPFVRLLGKQQSHNDSAGQFLACIVLPGKMERLPPPPFGIRLEPKKSTDPACASILEAIRTERQGRHDMRMERN